MKHKGGSKNALLLKLLPTDNLKDSRNTFCSVKMTHQLRIECLLSHQQLNYSIGRKHKSAVLLFTLTLKQSMLLQHNLLKPQMGPKKIAGSMQPLKFDAGVRSINFVSTKAIVKHSFYGGRNCIAKLLDTLRDWVLWCYCEKQIFRRLRISQQ